MWREPALMNLCLNASETATLVLWTLTLSGKENIVGDVRLEQHRPDTILWKKKVLRSLSLSHLILDFYLQHLFSITLNCSSSIKRLRFIVLNRFNFSSVMGIWVVKSAPNLAYSDFPSTNLGLNHIQFIPKRAMRHRIFPQVFSTKFPKSLSLCQTLINQKGRWPKDISPKEAIIGIWSDTIRRIAFWIILENQGSTQSRQETYQFYYASLLDHSQRKWKDNPTEANHKDPTHFLNWIALLRQIQSRSPPSTVHLYARWS